MVTRFNANMELLKPELRGVMPVTPARVSMEVVGGPTLVLTVGGRTNTVPAIRECFHLYLILMLETVNKCRVRQLCLSDSWAITLLRYHFLMSH